MVEVTFIKSDFILPGTKVNIDDYEGSIPDSEIPPLVDDEAPAAQLIARAIHAEGLPRRSALSRWPDSVSPLEKLR